MSSRVLVRLEDWEMRWGWEICGSGTRTLDGRGDSPALGSGLQLPM